MTVLTRPPEPDDGVHDQWYWPVGAGVMALFLAIAVIVQRGDLFPPGGAFLWAGIAALPWLADAVLFPLKRIAVPVSVFTLVVVSATVVLELDPVREDFGPFFLVLLTAEMASRLSFFRGLAVMGAAMGAMLGVEIWGSFDYSFIWFVGIALGWCGGVAIQKQFLLIEKMKESQANVAQRAVAEERQRIAREIHDVIAHTLSVTMLHLTGARLALERGDRDDAIAALHDAERMGRESLGDIRRTVGVLGSDGTGTDAPMPTAAELPELVAGFRAAGLDVALDVQGDPAGLPPALGLGIYRIAQESLANVAKHAPASHTDVQLAVDDDRVHLVVHDDDGRAVPQPAENGGLGLRGMRERAAALGGSLDARPDADGWLVEATLPRPDAPRRHRC